MPPPMRSTSKPTNNIAIGIYRTLPKSVYIPFAPSELALAQTIVSQCAYCLIRCVLNAEFIRTDPRLGGPWNVMVIHFYIFRRSAQHTPSKLFLICDSGFAGQKCSCRAISKLRNGSVFRTFKGGNLRDKAHLFLNL